MNLNASLVGHKVRIKPSPKAESILSGVLVNFTREIWAEGPDRYSYTIRDDGIDWRLSGEYPPDLV